MQSQNPKAMVLLNPPIIDVMCNFVHLLVEIKLIITIIMHFLKATSGFSLEVISLFFGFGFWRS